MDVSKASVADGLVIPAHPLALNAERKLDERRQVALTRYYRDAGAHGIAVAVHTTQFAIRERGLLRPVLELAAGAAPGLYKVAGALSVADAELARSLGYNAALINVSKAPDPIAYAKAVAQVLPLFGFYLQPAVGGCVLPYSFWREFAEIPNVIAIKIAPFNRYQTLDVLRAVRDVGRSREIAIYTGNDDSIIADLMTPPFVGGLLGHWSVWTRRAVEYHAQIRAGGLRGDWMSFAQQVTDANAALFDAANAFHGCIAGLHEILRRQGLLEGRWCLDPHEDLSSGQMEEIERVCREYPHLTDDDFVRQNLDRWLK